MINTANNTVIATVNVGSSPQDVAVSPLDNRVYVANNGSSSVSVINPAANNSVSTINVGSVPDSHWRSAPTSPLSWWHEATTASR